MENLKKLREFINQLFVSNERTHHTIPDQIVDVKTTEGGVEHHGTAFTYENNLGGDEQIILSGDYRFSVITQDNEYCLYVLYCRIQEPTFANKAIYWGQSPASIDLSLEQLKTILQLIEKMIFNENGLLNVLSYRKFICNITMFELFNESRKDAKHYNIVKRMIKDLTQKIGAAHINYFEEYKKTKLDRTFEINEFDGEALAEKVLSDGIYADENYNIMGDECRKMAEILNAKLDNFYATKQAAFEQLKTVTENIDDFSHLDAESIEKYTQLLYRMVYSTEPPAYDDDEPKTL